MKKGFIWLIPVLVLALVLAGCDGGGTGDSGGGGIKKLEFKGEQVWSMTTEGTYVAYTGADKVLTTTAGGAPATITGGKLFFNAEKPIAASLQPMNTFLTSISTLGDEFQIFSYAEWAPSSPVPNVMELVFTSEDLEKKYFNGSETLTTIERVRYIYVDRDCILTAAGLPNTSIPGVPGPVTISALNLNLKEGWNIINGRMMLTAAGNTASITKGDLGRCIWVLPETPL